MKVSKLFEIISRNVRSFMHGECQRRGRMGTTTFCVFERVVTRRRAKLWGYVSFKPSLAHFLVMESLSKNLFICFVICCLIYSFVLTSDLNRIKYHVVDKYDLEVHATFDNVWKAQEYVDKYKEFHNYTVQEVRIK